MTEIEKSIMDMKSGVVLMAIETAGALRDEASVLRNSYETYGGEEYDLDAFKIMLKKYKDFESTVPSMDVLYMTYNDLAIAHLDAMEFDKAIEYACALIHLSEQRNDTDGYKAGLATFGNIAIATGNFELAAMAYMESNGQDGSDLLSEMTYRWMQQKNNDMPAAFFKMPSINEIPLVKKPSSFPLIADPEKKKVEENIRMIMSMFHISRQQAKAYLPVCKK